MLAAEQIFVAMATRHRINDGPGLRRQRQFMVAMVLCARAGNVPFTSVSLELVPAHAANLVLALAGQDQQPKDAAIFIIAAGVPYRPQLPAPAPPGRNSRSRRSAS